MIEGAERRQRTLTGFPGASHVLSKLPFRTTPRCPVVLLGSASPGENGASRAERYVRSGPDLRFQLATEWQDFQAMGQRREVGLHLNQYGRALGRRWEQRDGRLAPGLSIRVKLHRKTLFNGVRERKRHTAARRDRRE